MRDFLLLLKVQLNSFFNGGRGRKRNNKAPSKKPKTTLMIVVFLLFTALSVFYSVLLCDVFSILNATYIVPAIMTLFFVFLIVFHGIYDAVSNLFGFKDYDFLSSLPVKKSTIILSKLAFLYLFDVAVAFIMTFPACIVHSIYSPQNFFFYLSSILNCFLLPIIPLAITLVIAVLIKLIFSRFKYKQFVETIFALIFFVAIFIASYFLGGIEEADPAILEIGVLGFVSKLYTDVIYLLIFAVLSIGVGTGVVFAISKVYHKLYTLITSVKTFGDYKVKELKTSSPIKTLMKKEFSRIFSMATYALNSLVGLLLSVIAIIFVCVLSFIFDGFDIGYARELILPYFLPVFAFLLGTATTTTASISLEGKSFSLLKSIPVSMETVLTAKLLTGLCFTLPVAIICPIIFAISYKCSFIITLCLILSSALLAVGINAWGLVLNARFLNLNWINPAQPVKQGAPVILTMLINYALAGVLLFISIKTASIGVMSVILTLPITGIFATVALLILFNKSTKRLKDVAL